MYCQDWVEKNENYLINSNLSSQRVSELLSEIKYSEIMQFYESWSSSFIEDEYLALDITSISSYSNLINHVEAGYNRDGENLEQVNICLLFGQKSGLPVYSSLYSGSLNDVTIFKSFIEQVEFFNQKKYNLVMDKGFYSANNIKTLLKKYLKYNFLISVPFTTLLSRQIVSNSLEKFEKNSIIKIGEDLLFSYSKIEKLNNIDSVKYHIFYNENLKHQIKFNLTKKLSK
jgi:transposase